MYAKLAWRNVRRSLQDYSIYFLTVVFAVAIFYVFNSLGDQPAFSVLGESTRRLAQGAIMAMSWVSIIMTAVVALLVLHANRVIIKKRSRELGTYLLLGMEQGRLALLLLAEIVVVGAGALLVGLVCGIFLSQFFALVVNRVLAVELTQHTFVFSTASVTKTVFFYGFTFVLVGLWQAAAVYRQKLIDLIVGSKKNETIRLQSPLLTWIAAISSFVSLGTAYWLADQVSRDVGITTRDPRILAGCLLGILGTYMLFAAFAGWLPKLRQRTGGWLSRGLNLFLYRQVTSKIKTHAVLLATLTLMLTFSICAMSTGMGLGWGIGGRADREAPFDYMLFSFSPDETFSWALNLFETHEVDVQGMVQFHTAMSDVQNKDLMLPADVDWFASSGPAEFVRDVQVTIMPYSAYESLRALKAYPEVTLSEKGFLIHATEAQTEPERKARQAFQRFLEANTELTFAGQRLYPGAKTVLTEPLGTQLAGVSALLVVPDEVAEALPFGESYLVLDVKGRAPELDRALLQRAEEESDARMTYISVISRADVIGVGFVTEGMLVFLTLYMGVMFILVSATLLALQQVTDAVEHRQRFNVLRKLGADESMINGTIARQLGLYFLTPVIIALLHSVMALVALHRLLFLGAGYTTVVPAALVTGSIFILIYGAYYSLSLQSCRLLFRDPAFQ